MDSQTRSFDTVFEQFDSAIRETMMQIHRARGERSQRDLERINWKLERDEIQRSAESRIEATKRASIEPIQNALRSAVSRIDRILDGKSSENDGTTSEDA